MPPRPLSFALIVALLAGSFPVSVSAAPTPFPDMEYSWYRYKEAVDGLVDRKIIGGYPDGTFKPQETINRAELLKIVFAGEKGLKAPKRRCFRDVNPRAWFAKYVCTALDRGIIEGYKNGNFKPAQPVNIAEALKIVMNAYGYDVQPGAGKAWYEPYADALDSADVLSKQSYVPWAPLTRERAADLVWRVLRYKEDHVNPRFSPGCKIHAGAMPSSVEVNGVRRHFLLTVPAGQGSGKPAPLVIAFHGRTSPNTEVSRYYRLDREMPEAFIVYPEGLPAGKGSFTWSGPGSKAGDILLFDTIVETIADRYCIDMDDITVVGHSLGGNFANALACARGGVIKASASVGSSTVSMPCTGPASAMLIHNPKDNLAAFSGGEKARELKAAQNFCSWDVTPTEPSSLNCVRHAGCAADAELLWCPHTQDIDTRGQYYPHNWPRETGREIVKFFRSLD